MFLDKLIASLAKSQNYKRYVDWWNFLTSDNSKAQNTTSMYYVSNA